MVQLYSLMWVLGTFFAVIGFMRGWNREIIATAGIFLGLFTLFQFDSLIRGTILLTFPSDQVFFIQVAIFLIIVFFSYQTRSFGVTRPGGVGFQAGLLGGMVGFFNGYLIGGTLWYFMDINEYPLAPYILAPAANSPSAQNLGTMPLLILSGGAGGGGEFLIIAVIFLFLLVLVVI